MISLMRLFVGNPDKASSEMDLSKRRIVALNLARFLSIGIVASLFIGCTNKTPTLPVITAQGPTIFWPTDGWQTSSPEKQGMDSKILANMMDTIAEQNLSIDSVLIIRNGFLVLDAVVYPFEPNVKHNIFSCTKSVISALIGISIDRGLIESVDHPVLDFFPNRIIQNLDTEKEAMTLDDR